MIEQVTNMMNDMMGIMYLKQSLFKYTSAAKAFADQARQELEDKMEGKAIQEAFIQEGLFLTTSNAKKSLSKKMKMQKSWWQTSRKCG